MRIRGRWKQGEEGGIRTAILRVFRSRGCLMKFPLDKLCSVVFQKKKKKTL